MSTYYYVVRRDRGQWLPRWSAGDSSYATKSYVEALRQLERVRDSVKPPWVCPPLAIYRRRGGATANPWRRMDEPSDTRCPT